MFLLTHASWAEPTGSVNLHHEKALLPQQKGIGEPHVFLLTCASWEEPTGSVNLHAITRGHCHPNKKCLALEFTTTTQISKIHFDLVIRLTLKLGILDPKRKNKREAIRGMQALVSLKKEFI